MRLAYTMAPGRGDTDLLLQQLVDRIAARRMRTCGTVQINSVSDVSHPCDMDVKVLPDGPVLRISQSLGRESRGCRLDQAALESAIAQTSAILERGADVLIVNKFGKHEAEGRGFRHVIADALSRDISVLVGLNRLNEPAFLKFSQDLALELPPTLDDLERWIVNG